MKIQILTYIIFTNPNKQKNADLETRAKVLWIYADESFQIQASEHLERGKSGRVRCELHLRYERGSVS